MRRYRKGEMFRPPTAAESAANADALEAFRRRASEPQDKPPRGGDIVRTPTGGIAGRVGTTISSATCTRCVESNEAGEKTLTETDEEMLVYNLDTTAVAGGIYTKVGITLGGTLCVDKGGGSGHATIRFEVISAGPSYANTSIECFNVTATVLDVSCGEGGVAAYDEVIIWDPSGCWFDIPIDNLENAHGTAIQMSRGDSFAISQCSEDDPDETCFWMVINLCCLEEVAAY